MSRHVYNAGMLLGVVLVSVGAGMVYVPAGVVSAGVLVMVLTAYGARVARG